MTSLQRFRSRHPNRLSSGVSLVDNALLVVGAVVLAVVLLKVVGLVLGGVWFLLKVGLLVGVLYLAARLALRAARRS